MLLRFFHFWCKPFQEQRKRQRGVVLLITVLLLSLLILVVLQLSFSTKTEVTVSKRYQDVFVREAAFQTGIDLTRKLLRIDYVRDRNIPNLRPADSEHEFWASSDSRRLGDHTSIQWRIEDVNRRINLNYLVKPEGQRGEGSTGQSGSQSNREKLVKNPEYVKIVRRLFRLLNIPVENVTRLVDFMDTNEVGAYEENAKNRRLYSLEELIRIKGFEARDVYGSENRKGLIDFVTLWSNGKINVNTAGAVVLQALAPRGQLSEATARSIVRYRHRGGQEGVFRSLDEFLNIAPLQKRSKKQLRQILRNQSYLAVQSNAFVVYLELTHHSEKQYAQAVLSRQSGKAVDVRWFHRGRRLWRKEADFR